MSLLGALVILASIIPRRRRFVPPGPVLTEAAAPGLFHELGSISEATAVPLPAQVYAVLEVNAGVARVGGFLGVGAREILLVGLPLMAVLTVSELRSVLAHEFGHYHGGETKLGPVIYRTRQAMMRTLSGLEIGGTLSVVRMPFVMYARTFMRITQAVSRRQELDADRMAATVAGPASAQSAVRKIHSAAFG